MDLIRLIISEWRNNEVTSEECINVISVLANLKHPNENEIEYIKSMVIKLGGMSHEA